MLKFSPANAKTKALYKIPGLATYLSGRRNKVYSFDLLSGWTCPGAMNCKSRAIMNDGKLTIKDGQYTQFRCFSASQEALFTRTYQLRKHNTDLIKATKGIEALTEYLDLWLPTNCGVLRYHVGGDWFKQEYLLAAIRLAEKRPEVLFYAYTKSLHHLGGVKPVDLSRGILRPNFLITASRGGKYDELIKVLNIRTAEVVYSEEEAANKGLDIDHSDEHAALPGGSFALLIHGIQPKGSVASKALAQLSSKGSYNRKGR